MVTDTYIKPLYVYQDIFPEPEGETVEFKQNISEAGIETYRKTLCAFANHIGGSIFFGVNDKTREIEGTRVDDNSIDFWKLKFDEILLKMYPYFNGNLRLIIYKITNKLKLIEVKLEKNIDHDNKMLYYLDDGYAYKRWNASNRKVGYTELVERSTYNTMKNRYLDMEEKYKKTKKLLKEADYRKKEEIEGLLNEYNEVLSLYDKAYSQSIKVINKIETNKESGLVEFLKFCRCL
jgi:predicted HTH transcriptional regulator